MNTLRKKNADVIADMSEQIDSMQRNRLKTDKEKSEMQMEIDDLSTNLEQVTKSKISLEKVTKNVEEQLTAAGYKETELSRDLGEINILKDRLMTENQEILKQIEEKNSLILQLTRAKNIYAQNLEEVKRSLDEETNAKTALAHAVQAKTQENDLLKEQYEEEMETKAELQRTILKCNTELVQWKTKYETDAIQRNEELEDAKRKITNRLQEAEDNVEATQAKCASLEKAKSRQTAEIDDLTTDLDTAKHVISAFEKKQPQG